MGVVDFNLRRNSSCDHLAPEGASSRTAMLMYFAAEQYGQTLADVKSDIQDWLVDRALRAGSPVFDCSIS